MEFNHGFIRRLAKNGVIHMIFINEEDETESDREEESMNKENQVAQEILNNAAIAACDTSVDNETMVGI